MRRPRPWFAPTDSGGLGLPSGPTTEALPLAWLDGDRHAAQIAEGCHVPGRTDRGFKTPRRSAERRCRVPLSSGDPGDKPRPVTARLSALPLPPILSEGHPEPPTHAKRFAGSDDARPEGAMTVMI